MISMNLKSTMSILSNRLGITLSWSKPELPNNTILRYELVRKKASTPAHYFDGKLVYSGTANEYIDTDVRSGNIYYYRLFVIVDEDYNNGYLTDEQCVVKSMAFGAEMKTYADKLYATLPEQVRYDDDKQNRNLPLYRFFQLFLTEFDKVNVINDSILDQFDVDICDESLLPLHAKWIGLEYDRNFDVDTNRLILSTWNEAEQYQGTATGVKYLLQRVFKSEVQINVDTTVEIVVIELLLDEQHYWMINSEARIQELIKKYLAMRTKYSLAFRLLAADEYDVSKLDDWFFDILRDYHFTENYNERECCIASEEFLLSDNFFFSDHCENRIKDELIDKLIDDIGVDPYLHQIVDELCDAIITQYNERYTALKRKEQFFETSYDFYGVDYYDKRGEISSEEFLISDSFVFGCESQIPVKDDSADTFYTDDEDIYVDVIPDTVCSEDSLICEMWFCGCHDPENRDKLFDVIYDDKNDVYVKDVKDDSIDKATTLDEDRVDHLTVIGEQFISDSFMFVGCGAFDSVKDNIIDIQDDEYRLHSDLILSDNRSFISSFGFAATPEINDTLCDKTCVIDDDKYNTRSVDDEDIVLISEPISDEKIRDTSLLSDDSSLFANSLMFCGGIFVDELKDTVVYVRPVGLFASADALIGMTMYLSDNLI